MKCMWIKYSEGMSHLCSSAYLALRQIAAIRRYLIEENTVQLVCLFVLSRLDYCNATLAGLPATHIARLQRIQNNAGLYVLQKSTRQHVTPLLKQLHWLYTLTINLQHLLFDILMVLWLSISLQGWTYISHSDRLDQAMTGSQGSTLGTEIFRVQAFQLPRICRLELSSH